MPLQPEMKGFFKFLKEKELSKERDRLLVKLALSTMSPRDFMDEYPCLHEKVQPIGVEFLISDTVKSDCGFIGYISNLSGDLVEARTHDGRGGNRNFSKNQLKHYHDLEEERRDNPGLDAFMEGYV